MRNHHDFDRSFNRTSLFIRCVFAFIIVVKLLMLAAIVYVIYWAFTSDVSFNDIGNMIGSFVGSIQNGMEKPQ